MLDKVEFNARFAVSAERVVVTFTVKNDSAADIFLIDHAFDVVSGGAVAPRPDHLVVTFPESSVAVLSTKLPPLDPNVAWATPPKIYATAVHPGQSYSSQASALVPLRTQSFRMPKDEQGRELPGKVSTESCTRLHFELGVIPAGPTVAGTPTVLGGIPVAELGPRAAAAQVVLSADHTGASVPCVRVT